MTAESAADSTRRHRPKATTVFVAAFLAGAVAAVVVNRMLDLHLAQAKPQVESEPIFVALRALPQGSPVTVWDVALRDWPRAMLPSTALRASDSFEGSILKYPLRAGQPLLSVHLLPVAAAAPPAAATEEAFVKPQVAPPTPSRRESDPDLWTPGSTAAKPAAPATRAPKPEPPRETVSFAVVPLEEPADQQQPVAETLADTLPEAELEPVAEPVAGAAVTAETSVAQGQETATEQVAADAATIAEVTEDALMDNPLPAAEPVAKASEQATTVGVPTLVAVEPPTEEAPAPEEEPAEVAGPAMSRPRPAVAETTGRRQSDLPLPGRLAPEPDTATDMPQQTAVDLDSIPSVLAGSDMESDPVDAPPAAGNLRYLVVPERIARQADTMFAPPVAAEPKAVTEPKTMAKPIEQPRPPARPQPSQGQSSQSRAQNVGPRAWGGMFPNVAAGIETIGTRWRGEERSAVEPRQTPQQRR